VIFALNDRVSEVMTDETRSLAVESDLLVSTDIPASLCSSVRATTPALALNRATSGTPNVSVLDVMLVSCPLTWKLIRVKVKVKHKSR
jgi:hypothetical protein